VGSGARVHGFGCFSPDSKTLVTVQRDGTIQLWDVATGRAIRRLPGHSDALRKPVGNAQQTEKIEQENWRIVASICLGFFAEGKVLASYGADHTIRHWDVTTGKELRRHRLATDDHFSFDFS